MIVGVYAIARNEAANAARWAASTVDADYALVADTGSTDATTEILAAHKVTVASIAVHPWRFDDARNASLLLLPRDLDVVVCLDLDEILVPGWRQMLERAWTPTTTRLRYRYVWSWTATQQPDVIFYYDKICKRFSHRWKGPVHEVLCPTVPEVITLCDTTLIEHHADSTKSRVQYLPLLELAVAEDPHDDRSAHYLGREYYFHGRYREAIAELQRHLTLPRAVWLPERAASMRYIAKCYEALGEWQHAHRWFARAPLEDPGSREALIDAARFALSQNEFYQAIAFCQTALALPGSLDYMAERYAQHEGADDLLGVALWHVGQPLQARLHVASACRQNPADERLQRNLRMMSGATS